MVETLGDMARAEVAKRKRVYYDDVLAEIRDSLSPQSAPLLAAACAERLLLRHLALPPENQRPFTVGWRAPMNALWRALTSSGAASDRRAVECALGAFYHSALNHSDGQDGPDDADDDSAAACIYAAEAFLEGDVDSASWAASRLVDDAFSRAADERRAAVATVEDVLEFVEDCCHVLVQQELRWLIEVADLSTSSPLTNDIIAETRKRTGAQPSLAPDG